MIFQVWQQSTNMYLLDTYLLLDSSQKRGNEPDRLPRLPARLNDPPSHGISVDDRDPKLAKHVRHRALSRCHPTLTKLALLTFNNPYEEE